MASLRGRIFRLLFLSLILGLLIFLFRQPPSLITTTTTNGAGGEEGEEKQLATAVIYYLLIYGLITVLVTSCLCCGQSKVSKTNLPYYCFGSAFLLLLGPYVDDEYFPINNAIKISCTIYSLTGILLLLIKRYCYNRSTNSVTNTDNWGDVEAGGNNKRR